MHDIGDDAKAIDLLDYCMKMLPLKNTGYSAFLPKIAEMYYVSGAKEKGDTFSDQLLQGLSGIFEYADEQLQWKSANSGLNEELRMEMYIAVELLKLTSTYSNDIYEKYRGTIENYYSKYFINRNNG